MVRHSIGGSSKSFNSTQPPSPEWSCHSTHQTGSFLNGFTENYIKVKVPYETALENTIQQINISTIDSENVAEGELILNYKLEV